SKHRNDSLFVWGRSLKRNGASPTAIMRELEYLNRTMCQPPLDDAEVSQISKNVWTEPCYLHGVPTRNSIRASREPSTTFSKMFRHAAAQSSIMPCGIRWTFGAHHDGSTHASVWGTARSIGQAARRS